MYIILITGSFFKRNWLPNKHLYTLLVQGYMFTDSREGELLLSSLQSALPQVRMCRRYQLTICDIGHNIYDI